MFLTKAVSNAVIIKLNRPMENVCWIRFMRENNFICLFFGIRVELHFPLIGPLANFILWTFEKRDVSYQKFCIINLCYLVDHLCKSRIEVVLTPILVVLQKRLLSTLKFDNLRLLFLCAFGDGFLKVKVAHLERHMLLTIRDHHAKLCQMF